MQKRRNASLAVGVADNFDGDLGHVMPADAEFLRSGDRDIEDTIGLFRTAVGDYQLD